ncbi:AraC family transcriptional regulator [Burkholderia sp. AU19243]|uniref:AraC family transcriptional regulator n=1 Tax=Burkholderia latens TaxID=488446 RepID=A0AAP1C878_9BURK|nr:MULTISPECIES: AraC family transcriptional regulator [Burkholderia]AIO37414.1 helix-turn-helix domain protein [Burkholderia cenocepacia]MBR7962729.1 AraC family transcriptional regulator [Burkholderia vietnamiensis]KVA08805.1 AraC family transcriptional regulator [Burkholderia latens]MBR8363815.1 AraC family transcriptional regulator [Burkholderia sp. AU19243]MBY4693505.1 AraC family transcriptional regulator [Burkholderia latens]
MGQFSGTGWLGDAACFNRDTLLLQSNDLDEVRARVGDVFKPHRLALTGNSRVLHSRMHHARWGNLSLNLLDYGGEVSIEPGPLEHFYLLQIPLRGDAEIECGAARFVSSPDTASLLSPTLALRMRWGEACPQVVLRIERDVMERHAQRHFGDDRRAPVEFEPEFGLASPQGACLTQMLPVLTDAIATDGHPLRHPLAFEQLESTLLNLLLYGHPNTARDRTRPAPAPLAPFYVRRVEEYIRAHVDEPLTIERLAELAGVSPSTLFAGFRARHGITPMAFVRRLRLQHVRDELLDDATPALASVTDIALKWGFAHLGRFAIDYKRAFGESPSATLRMRRVRG